MDLIDKLSEHAYSFSSDLLIGTDRQLLAMVTLSRQSTTKPERVELEVVGCPWQNDVEKRNMIFELAAQIALSKSPVVAYSFLSECWSATYLDGDQRPRVAARLAPHRREAVICLASDGAQHRSRCWEIGRDKAGRCTSLAGIEMPMTGFESWILDALDFALNLRRQLGAPPHEP